jgi:D-methionine transport system ATP-binding protein
MSTNLLSSSGRETLLASAMIAIGNVEKTFPGRTGGPSVVALENVDLTVGRGEIFGIIGRSGAGKSTLLRVINGLETPTGGWVVVDGVDIGRLPPAELRRTRRSIGMVFQHFNLLSSRTVFDNIALPLELAGASRKAIREAVDPLIELVGLSDKRDRYPAELSGGQKQRVGIARALAHRPKVLLSDEATSALDPETTQQILELLAGINRRLGVTIVLITHEIAVIKEICHKVAVMDEGRVVETGPVFDVFAHPRHPTTRSFVDPVINRDLPVHLATRLSGDASTGNPVLRITFTGDSATTPVISVLSRRLNLDLNIWHGQVDEIQGRPFGTLVVEASGAPDAIDAAISLLNVQKLGVEVLGYADIRHLDVAV